jgi:acetylornithine deacetylase/succinyl-diaminopimelate desuccinylase-like protein
MTLRLVSSPGGHGSRPRCDNAIYELTEALGAGSPVSGGQTKPPELFPSRAVLRADGDCDEGPRGRSRFGIRHRASVVGSLRILMRGLRRDATRATPSCADGAAIVVPDPSQQAPEEIVVAVRQVVANDAVKLTVAYEPFASPPSPLMSDVMGPVTRIAEEMYPGIPILAEMSAGASDGAHLRNIGIPTYGVSALAEDTDDIRAHGRDERIRVKSFYDSVEYWYRLMRAL